MKWVFYIVGAFALLTAILTVNEARTILDEIVSILVGMFGMMAIGLGLMFRRNRTKP